MTNKPADVAQEEAKGIDVNNVTFDEKGEAQGLSDEALKDISGGLLSDSADTNFGCDSGC